MLVKIALAILIIAAIAVGGIFYSDYLSQSTQAESVNTAIQNDKNANTVTSKNIQKINGEIVETNQKMDSIKAAILSEENVLPDKTNPNEIVKEIISQSKSSGVNIVSLNTQDWAKTTIDKLNYQVLRINLGGKGQQAGIVDFIGKMQNTIYKTLVIDNISVTRPLDPLDTDIIAELNLAVYAR
jgi:Tfp pilus assembly protein PilO